jgi:hypothetical protein
VDRDKVDVCVAVRTQVIERVPVPELLEVGGFVRVHVPLLVKDSVNVAACVSVTVRDGEHDTVGVDEGETLSVHVPVPERVSVDVCD